MFSMCIDRGCVCKRESNLGFVCVFTEGALLHGRISYGLYVY